MHNYKITKLDLAMLIMRFILSKHIGTLIIPCELVRDDDETNQLYMVDFTSSKLPYLIQQLQNQCTYDELRSLYDVFVGHINTSKQYTYYDLVQMGLAQQYVIVNEKEFSE